MEETPSSSRETLEQLDWPWILEQVRKNLYTEPARESCPHLLWVPSREAALACMQEVEEARTLMSRGNPFPLGMPPDIRPLILGVSKEAVLKPEDLLDLASWMETVDAVRRHLVIHRSEAPLLHRHVSSAPSLSHLIYDIRSAVDENAEVRDEASPELGVLRKRARKIHQEIHAKLERYLHASDFQDLLQDRFYTIKEDRYVLPIKTNQKTFVDGIVLGSSSSGATLFIEPREIVDLNNHYKLALLETQKETLRILQEICEHIRLDARDLERGLQFLTRIDLIGARARFAELLDANPPTLNQEEGIRILKARHPILLLAREHVVSNDITITPPIRTLLLTGPNAGGKTASLKTVGLFALMVKAGLPLPAGPGSNIPFFETIFSDIGDSQSLHESRSTFSGHLIRLVEFLASNPGAGLALIDEILIGTDSEEGSALAQAVLEHLSELGGISLATTHYLSLKSLAARDPRIENASLGFHPETLQPTYELTIGVPGASNALFLAQQCGLPPPILEKARSLLGGSETDIQELLFQIQAEKVKAESERTRQEGLRCEAQTLKQELGNKIAEAEAREKEVKRKYKEKLEQVFNEALQELHDLKKRGKKETHPSASPARAEKELLEIKHRLLSEDGPFHVPLPLPRGQREIPWSDIASGDVVYIPELQTDAKVIKIPDRKGSLLVEAKGFRMHVKAQKVYKPRKEQTGKKERKRESQLVSRAVRLQKAMDDKPTPFTDRCDLRGMTVEDALNAASQSLDRGVRAGIPRMVLIHGLGKGILRNAVRDYLSECPYTLTFRPGDVHEGGDGVTVVEFG